MDAIAVSVTDGVQGASIESYLEEEIRVVEEFENRLKFVTFTIMGDSPGEDGNNNSPTRGSVS